MKSKSQKSDEARAELPQDAKEPTIREFTSTDDPILTISVASTVLPQRVLVNLTQELQDLVETHPNVLEAELNGVPEDLIEAIVDKSKLESYGISMNQLFQAVSNNNRVIPAGYQDTGTGRFAVNVPSVFSSLEDIESLPIKVSGNSVVTLKDVADVSLTFKDRGGYSRINGQQSLSIDVKKRIGTNIIDTVTDIRSMVEKKIKSFPEGVDVNFVRDDSEFALQMISELQGNVLTSIALVMIVVLAALGFRTSMLVGMAIPFSYLFALLVLFVMDKEFNFMVMFGMLISMGMTIDGSIVVTEYADRKLAMPGDDTQLKIQGIQVKDPSFGLDAYWIEKHMVSKAEANHYMVIDPEAVIGTHLNQILLKYAGELLSQDDVQFLLDNLSKVNPQLVQSVVPKLIPLHHLTIILRNLLVERLPINDLKKILEALSNLSDKKLTPDELSELVRPAISSLLIQKISSVNEPLNVCTFNPDFEQMLISMSKKSGSEGILIDPSLAKQMIQSILDISEKLSADDKSVVIVTSPVIRKDLSILLRQHIDDVVVLAFTELPENKKVKVLATIGEKILTEEKEKTNEHTTI